MHEHIESHPGRHRGAIELTLHQSAQASRSRHLGVVTPIVDPYPSLARKLQLMLILNGRAQASVAAAQKRSATEHHSRLDDALLARRRPG